MTWIKYILTGQFKTLVLLHFCGTLLFNWKRNSSLFHRMNKWNPTLWIASGKFGFLIQHTHIMMSILLILQPLPFLQSDAQYWPHRSPGVKCLNQEPSDERRSPPFGVWTINYLNTLCCFVIINFCLLYFSIASNSYEVIISKTFNHLSLFFLHCLSLQRKRSPMLHRVSSKNHDFVIQSFFSYSFPIVFSKKDHVLFRQSWNQCNKIILRVFSHLAGLVWLQLTLLVRFI